jgi:hypothetical protein
MFLKIRFPMGAVRENSALFFPKNFADNQLFATFTQSLFFHIFEIVNLICCSENAYPDKEQAFLF